ncbi:MAG: hypothetical protein IJI34_01915 [Clostridia bacterium]|nr:hypothetical protein [Clostridia bacterium]
MMKPRQSETKRRLAEEATALFNEFRNAYANEWRRQEHNERMYRGEHWYDVPVTDPNEPRPVTPILQSTIENVTADLADQTPEAVIEPESAADAYAAQVIDAVVRRNHDAASYPVEYRRMIHDLLVGGWCVQEVGYDSAENGGLGGAFIRHVDIRSILVDPLVTDLQDGRAVFKLALRPKAWIEAHYPDVYPLIESRPTNDAELITDEILSPDPKNACLLIEYWRREYDAQDDVTRVHMALLCNGVVLEDSRDVKPEGYFSHGRYPFVLTTLYPRKGSALGFGVVDLFGTMQRYADKLDQLVLKNAFLASRNKLLVTDASGFDPDDLRDWSKDVHTGENLNGVTWMTTAPLPNYLLSYIRSIREDIKEESGANDSSRGAAPSGVTAARAIEALQEMSTKRARMASDLLHEAFREAVRMEIETEREFNCYLRPVTVTVDGEPKEVFFDSDVLLKNAPGGVQLPVEFLISIKAVRRSRFAAAAQNELVMSLLSLGAVTKEQAISLMVFEGKEQVLKGMREAASEIEPLFPERTKKKRFGGKL